MLIRMLTRHYASFKHHPQTIKQLGFETNLHFKKPEDETPDNVHTKTELLKNIFKKVLNGGAFWKQDSLYHFRGELAPKASSIVPKDATLRFHADSVWYMGQTTLAISVKDPQGHYELKADSDFHDLMGLRGNPDQLKPAQDPKPKLTRA